MPTCLPNFCIKLYLVISEMRKADWIILAWLTVFAAAVLFFVSPDSYFCAPHHRIDSAWFFICGKAWMNGYVPYVDFTDSKGPVLWLIYGLGYLIDHTSYVGMYWIASLWYGLTFFFTFRIARLFLDDNKKALICAFLMALAYFNSWFHVEVRAEDFSLLFMVISLYEVCRLYYGETADDKALLKTCGILGACFSALLLIKFNLAVMQAAFILCVLYYLIREKQSVVKPLLCGFGGFVVVCTPFVIYFLASGCFSAFLHEYFVKTVQTVNGEGASLTAIIWSYLREWRDLEKADLGALLLFLIIGGLSFTRGKTGPYRWMPLLVSLYFFALSIMHHIEVSYLYYFNICSFLLIFLVLELVSYLNDSSLKLVVTSAVSSFIIVASFNYVREIYNVAFFNDTKERREYYMAAHIMSQVKTPKLINAYWIEHGYGMPAGVLPAGKYWSAQLMMTSDMMREHERLIQSGEADFIIVPAKELVSENRLAEMGYKEYLRLHTFTELVLFSKWDNLDTTDFVCPTNREILFKKR